MGKNKASQSVAQKGIGVVSVIGLAALVAWCAIPEGEPTPEELATAAAEREACRQDLACWRDANRTAASILCLSAIDRAAGDAAQWNDGTNLKLRYGRFDGRETGRLIYSGDQLSIAGVRQRFSCGYDPKTDELYDFTIEPFHEFIDEPLQ